MCIKTSIKFLKKSHYNKPINSLLYSETYYKLCEQCARFLSIKISKLESHVITVLYIYFPYISLDRYFNFNMVTDKIFFTQIRNKKCYYHT